MGDSLMPALAFASASFFLLTLPHLSKWAHVKVLAFEPSEEDSAFSQASD